MNGMTMEALRRARNTVKAHCEREAARAMPLTAGSMLSLDQLRDGVKLLTTQQKPKYRFDAPFFVIKKPGDIVYMATSLRNRRFNMAEWATDKNGNPFCRINMDWSPNRNGRHPERIATAVCKRHALRTLTETAINMLKEE